MHTGLLMIILLLLTRPVNSLSKNLCNWLPWIRRVFHEIDCTSDGRRDIIIRFSLQLDGSYAESRDYSRMMHNELYLDLTNTILRVYITLSMLPICRVLITSLIQARIYSLLTKFYNLYSALCNRVFQGCL